MHYEQDRFTPFDDVRSDRPPVWERSKMTVCIAASCVFEHGTDRAAIILCTDRKTSGPLGSAETALKQRALAKNWYALTSGAEADIMALDALLKANFKGSDEIDETNVAVKITDALLKRKKQRANELVIGKFAIPYEEFLSIGKDKFPSDIFRDTMSQIMSIRLPEFIIAGFDEAKFPIICQTNASGTVSIRDDFAVVGEGEYVATAVLLQRAQSYGTLVTETLYNVFEAKKYAEKVPSVGDRTSICILAQMARRQLIPKDDNGYRLSIRFSDQRMWTQRI
jgi:20S proteasome alpha/beta subunit